MKNQYEQLFGLYHKEHDFSGAGWIKKGDELIFGGAYGWAHRGYKVPNQINTMFDTASITKLFTATAILQLVDQGKLSLHDRITDVIDLSGTRIPADVTLTHLLTHTSGIADDADEELGESYEALFVEKPNYSIRSCADFIPQFAYKEPKFKAGTQVSYNNCAFVLLGLAIEQVTEESYWDYVTTHIFRPSGMNNTTFAAKDDADAPLAEGYDAIRTDDGEVIWHKNIYSFPPRGTADGGAFTAVGDLDLFMRALVHGKLLSAKLTAEIMKPQTHLERNYSQGKVVNGYGFHFTYDLQGKLIRMYKEGSNAGVAAMLAYYPEIDATNIILANQSCDVWELHREAEKMLLAQ